MPSRHDTADASTPAAAPVPRESDEDVAAVLEETLTYARERDYRGWDFGDGMSSRIRQAIPVENRWINIAFQEAVKRAPRNVRPLLLVEQRRNYKGTALFAMANQNAHWLHERSPAALAEPEDEGSYAAETGALLDWLVDERIEGYSGYCGGHRHRLQHLDGTIGEPDDPDVVSTSYAVKALLRGKYLDPEYADVARSAVPFVLEDLNYREVDDGAVVNYHMNHPDDVFTINAGALAARLLVDVHDHTDEGRFREDDYTGESRSRKDGHAGEIRSREAAERILDHVAGLQTDRGGWYYRDPPDSSHLSMDNHHNGFVVEAFQRYAEVVDDGRYDDTLSTALDFYETLFEPDGAPDFDEENAYPRDVHASAQGILVFTYAGDYELAGEIVDWTLENLYLGDGRFFFRKHRFHDKRHVLMRWCQAWMAYALSEYLRHRYVE